MVYRSLFCWFGGKIIVWYWSSL